jgi:hypothetical protein
VFRRAYKPTDVRHPEILIPKGSSIAWENLYGGLNVIEWDASLGEAGIPKALQLTSSPQEVFTSIKDTITNMGTLAGVNEVVRGNPDLALKGQISGASLALMTTNSIQFNSDIEQGIRSFGGTSRNGHGPLISGLRVPRSGERMRTEPAHPETPRYVRVGYPEVFQERVHEERYRQG